MGARAPVHSSGRAAGREGRREVLFSFFPWGLAPVLGLAVVFAAALGPLAFREVEAATQTTARRIIDEGGYTWARASVSGQWVSLEGAPPSREAAERLISALAGASAPTLLGEARPVGHIFDRLTWSDPVQAFRQPDPKPSPQPPAGGPADTVGTSQCDLLAPGGGGQATIEFPSNSDQIDPASTALLDRIASAARDCPSRLRIEGHTDNTGRDAANLSLSRRRAEAVRNALITRGVPADRLQAEGFGDARPVADNRAETGRARNRRIEIRTIAALPD